MLGPTSLYVKPLPPYSHFGLFSSAYYTSEVGSLFLVCPLLPSAARAPLLTVHTSAYSQAWGWEAKGLSCKQDDLSLIPITLRGRDRQLIG